MSDEVPPNLPEVLLGAHLKALKIPTCWRKTHTRARLCAAEGVDPVRYLARLVELELIDRERRMVERRIKAARFPAIKSLDSFDFAAIPKLNKMLVLELARCEWIERRENAIALGHPALARPMSLSAWDWPPARTGCRSASPRPPPSSAR